LALFFLPFLAHISLNPIALIISPFVIVVMLLNGYFVSDFNNVESVAKDLSKAV
jgi:hypothetical protein